MPPIDPRIVKAKRFPAHAAGMCSVFHFLVKVFKIGITRFFKYSLRPKLWTKSCFMI